MLFAASYFIFQIFALFSFFNIRESWWFLIWNWILWLWLNICIIFNWFRRFLIPSTCVTNGLYFMKTSDLILLARIRRATAIREKFSFIIWQIIFSVLWIDASTFFCISILPCLIFLLFFAPSFIKARSRHVLVFYCSSECLSWERKNLLNT